MFPDVVFIGYICGYFLTIYILIVLIKKQEQASNRNKSSKLILQNSDMFTSQQNFINRIKKSTTLVPIMTLYKTEYGYHISNNYSYSISNSGGVDSTGSVGNAIPDNEKKPLIKIYGPDASETSICYAIDDRYVTMSGYCSTVLRKCDNHSASSE